jgi:hypothetical protein
MKENQLISMLGVVLAAIFLTVPLLAADFEITKVIEVGPADRVPFIQPIKWSPDGTRLSYFKDNWLMISDTLGRTQPVYQSTMFPQRYEWLSENEIVLLQLGRLKGGKATKMSIIDLKTGQEDIIVDKKEKFREADENDSTFYYGPRVSIEGNVYYTIEKISGKRKIIPGSKYLAKDESEILSNNHFLSWGEDGVYKIRLDHTDSARIGPKPYPYMPMPPIMSPSGQYIVDGGTVLRLQDSTYLVLDTIVKWGVPNGVHCGINYFASFNASEDELLFQLSCDDGHSIYAERAGIFKMESHEVIILDTLLNFPSVSSAVFDNRDCRIALLASQKAYIVERGQKK